SPIPPAAAGQAGADTKKPLVLPSGFLLAASADSLDLRDMQEVGSAGLTEGEAGDDDDVVTLLGEALGLGGGGAEFDHLLDAVDLLESQRMHAPAESQATGGLDVRGQAQDRGGRTLTRGAQGGETGRGVGDGRGRTDQAGDLAQGAADGVRHRGFRRGTR